MILRIAWAVEMLDTDCVVGRSLTTTLTKETEWTSQLADAGGERSQAHLGAPAEAVDSG